jgi:uncharacterized protein YdaU (DUF1376 family)
LNYYRRYVGDYLRDTARLSMLEHGAYNLLLDYYYADEQPLPLDKDELYLMVRAMTPSDRKAVDKVIAKFFERQADGYHQKRADHEIEVSKKARTNGKGGGRPPGGNGTGSQTGLITGLETEDLTGSETEHETATITGEGGGSVHPPTTNHLSANHHPPTAILQPTSRPRGARSRPNGEKFEPPDWVPRQQWEAWIEARRKKRNAPTTFAMELAVAKLDELREQGHHPAAVLADAAFKGYAGLFPPKS